MTLIETKSLEDWRNTQLDKWQTLVTNINLNPDSMVYMDAQVIAEVLYLLQMDAVTLTNNAFIAYANGDELSNLGLDRGIPRITAVESIGEATFSRATLASTDYLIDTDIIISTQPDGNGRIISFQVTADTILYGTILTPTAPTGVSFTTGGAMPDGTYKYKITAITADDKETDASTEEEIVISSGTGTNRIELTWPAVTGAVKYKVYLDNGTGDFFEIDDPTSPSYTDDSGSTGGSTTEPPLTNETGNLTVDVPIVCLSGGTVGNIAVNTVTAFVKKPNGIENVTNNDAIIGGVDEESDEEYRERLREELSNNVSKVTVEGYIKTAKTVTGVGEVSVVHPYGERANQLAVYITSDSGNFVPDGALIAAVQAEIIKDENRAPCDNITVLAPDVFSMDVTVFVTEVADTYTETQAEDAIDAAIEAFIPGVGIGGLIRLVDLENVIHDLDEVNDFYITVPSANKQLNVDQLGIAGTITVNFP